MGPSDSASAAVLFDGEVSRPLTVTLSSGESFALPAGAVALAEWEKYKAKFPAGITLAIYAPPPAVMAATLPAGGRFAGSYVGLAPSGLQFQVAGTLSLKTTANPSSAALSIFYYNTAATPKTWDIQASLVQSAAGRVDASLAHFSTYAVLSYPPGATAPATTAAPDQTTAAADNGTAPGQTSAPVTSSGGGAAGPPIGIIAGVVGGVAVVGGILGFLYIRRRNKRRAVQVMPTPPRTHTHPNTHTLVSPLPPPLRFRPLCRWTF
jgi:hypothetical protein